MHAHMGDFPKFSHIISLVQLVKSGAHLDYWNSFHQNHESACLYVCVSVQTLTWANKFWDKKK